MKTEARPSIALVSVPKGNVNPNIHTISVRVQLDDDVTRQQFDDDACTQRKSLNTQVSDVQQLLNTHISAFENHAHVAVQHPNLFNDE